MKKPLKYYILSQKKDYLEIFQEVWKSLDNEEIVVIAPEGVSHDNYHVRPFKAGIAMMALGNTPEKVKSIPIIPMGYNHHRQHKFRSKILVEIG